MSAFTDVPSDLLDWAARTGRDVDPQGFLPRMEYAATCRTAWPRSPTTG